ncbi:MAG: hypothetical protein LN590_03270 [Rickettsia endosymbiont of Glossina mortisans submortisans]|nr:hypothetical protein [Rickettsia endosymbiont of Glossina mortisans submortisans]
MKYKFALNLQRMALSSKARSLWEQEEIQNKVIEFFKYEYMRSTYSDAERKQQEEKWHSITKEVLGRLEFHILPAKLESELIYVIREVGAKIYDWYAYVQEACSYEKLEEYTKQIYWTHYGNIDEIKIFKSFWLENHRLDISNIYEMACNYCLEEYTNNLWQQIPQEKRKSDFYTDTIYEKYQYHLIAYWQCYLDGDLKYLVRYFKRFDSDYKKIYNRHYSVEENIFKLSVYQGYSKAVRYFWDKLSDEEKDRNILDSAYTVINEFHKYRSSYNEIDNYTKEQYTDICTFLISKMSISQQQELFMSYDSSIFKMFLSHWPWQELLIPTLERMWSCVDGGSYQSLLNGITDKIRKDQELGYWIENSKYQRILHEIWHKSPACLKQKIDQSDRYSSNITTQLLDIWDLSTLKLIINDQDMAQRRWELIDKGHEKYVRLVKDDKYELLEQFIGEIFSAAEEQKSFKQKIEVWGYFIWFNRYDLADKLLNWQCSLEEEKHVLKSKIDHIRLVQRFIEEDKCELADKFLQWSFESAEEIKNCKHSFQDNQFSVDHIYRLWAVRTEDVEIVKEKLAKFNKFIDFWLRPLENLDLVKSKLESYVSCYYKEEQIEEHQMFMNLLNNLEQSNEMIEVSYMGASSNMEM